MPALELKIFVKSPTESVRFTLNAQEAACVEELTVTHGFEGSTTETLWKTHENLTLSHKAAVGVHTFMIDFVGYLPSGVLTLPEQTVGLSGVLPKIVDFNKDTVATTPYIWDPKTPPKNLREISEHLFEKNNQVTHLVGTFAGLPNLRSVPSRLLNPLTKAISFEALFKNSALENIPEGLFTANTNVQDFTRTFQDCKNLTFIPEGLFRRNSKAVDFTETFAHTGIMSLPSGLFGHVAKKGRFIRTFAACPLKEVPEGLFDGKAPGNVDGMFEGVGEATEDDPLKLGYAPRFPRTFFEEIRFATGVPTLSNNPTK